MKRRLFLSLCLLALCACAACSPYWYKKPDRFLVQNSRLNWAQIFYQASESAPRVRCDLRGVAASPPVGSLLGRVRTTTKPGSAARRGSARARDVQPIPESSHA